MNILIYLTFVIVVFLIVFCVRQNKRIKLLEKYGLSVSRCLTDLSKLSQNTSKSTKELATLVEVLSEELFEIKDFLDDSLKKGMESIDDTDDNDPSGNLN